MKTTKITYWISTGLITLMMLFSAFSYLTQDDMKNAFIHLGFPSYFRIELAVAKLIGAILILTPVPSRFKEWVYAGFAITFISALIAHTASGDPLSSTIIPIVFLLVLATSYASYHRLRVQPEIAPS
ncbi:MAG: DoxX family protein [Flavobacterium sp.]|nr:MAG: DoxX family protein [Flavobacterium sp.]